MAFQSPPRGSCAHVMVPLFPARAKPSARKKGAITDNLLGSARLSRRFAFFDLAPRGALVINEGSSCCKQVEPGGTGQLITWAQWQRVKS